MLHNQAVLQLDTDPVKEAASLRAAIDPLMLEPVLPVELEQLMLPVNAGNNNKRSFTCILVANMSTRRNKSFENDSADKESGGKLTCWRVSSALNLDPS